MGHIAKKYSDIVDNDKTPRTREMRREWWSGLQTSFYKELAEEYLPTQVKNSANRQATEIKLRMMVEDTDEGFECSECYYSELCELLIVAGMVD